MTETSQENAGWPAIIGGQLINSSITAIVSVATTLVVLHHGERFKMQESLYQSAVLDMRKAASEIWEAMAEYEKAMYELPSLRGDETRAANVQRIFPASTKERRDFSAEIARQDDVRVEQLKKIESVIAARRHVIGEKLHDHFKTYAGLVIAHTQALADSYDKDKGGEYMTQIHREAAAAYEKQLKLARFPITRIQPD